MTTNLTDDYESGTQRCDYCNTPLWDHEKEFGRCQSCRLEDHRRRRERGRHV